MPSAVSSGFMLTWVPRDTFGSAMVRVRAGPLAASRDVIAPRAVAVASCSPRRLPVVAAPPWRACRRCTGARPRSSRPRWTARNWAPVMNCARDMLPGGGGEGSRTGQSGVERRGPCRVQVKRVGQHPADAVQRAGRQQLRDLAVGGGRDGLVDLLPGLFGVAQQRRLRHAGVVAGGDGVQVAAFGHQTRVGPHLVARVHASRPGRRGRAARPTVPAGRPRAPGRPPRAGAARRPWPAPCRRAPRDTPCRARWPGWTATAPGWPADRPGTRRRARRARTRCRPRRTGAGPPAAP